MKGIALFLSLAITSCATPHSTKVDLGPYGPVVDTLFQRMGNRELLLCLDGQLKGKTWVVRGVSVPLQTADSASVDGAGCTNTSGDVHNHPKLGGLYDFREINWFSDIDIRGFAARSNLQFTVLWYAPGKFTAKVKKEML